MSVEVTAPVDTTPQRALLVRGSEAELLDSDPSGTITLLADSSATGGALNSHRSTFAQGADGAPPHFHTTSSEVFFVIDGALQVLLGEEVVILNKGDFLVVPPNVPHAFAAAPGTDADALFLFTPGLDRFDYYRLLDRVHKARQPGKTWATPRTATTTTTWTAPRGSAPARSSGPFAPTPPSEPKVAGLIAGTSSKRRNYAEVWPLLGRSGGDLRRGRRGNGDRLIRRQERQLGQRRRVYPGGPRHLHERGPDRTHHGRDRRVSWRHGEAPIPHRPPLKSELPVPLSHSTKRRPRPRSMCLPGR